MSPIYTGDKLGFGASTSAGGGGGKDVYNNAGLVFTHCGAYGSGGPTSTDFENEYKDQKFWTGNHYFNYWGGAYQGFIFVRAPQSGTYAFDIRGAFGGQSPNWTDRQNKGGSPWYLKGEVDLVGGRWLGVVVGQKGGETSGSNGGGGGGGGTFLFELDGSESEDTLTKSYVESASVTCLLVAAGGNGSNGQNWSSYDVPSRGETTSGNWITSTVNAGNNWGWDIFGRGGFGGSFMYTPYSTVDAGSGSADNPRYYDYPSRPRISGNPLLDVNGKIHEGSLWGGVHWDGNSNRYSNKNTDPNQSGEGAFGGFGGGAGAYYEGGGGGGYWGGAAWQTNQYSTQYTYGAQSYVHPTRVTVETSRIYGDGESDSGDALCGLDRYSRCRRQYENGGPHRESNGKLYLCPKKPKATAIGEAVFHADGHNIGKDRTGVGKVTKYDWYVPEGVSSISVLSIGAGGSGYAGHDGGSGGGGALSYKNNIAVAPGQKIGVQVGCGGFHSEYGISQRSPKGTDSKITVYPMTSGTNGGSVVFDGSSVIKLGTDSGADPVFSIGGGISFCMEAWVYLTNMSSYNNIFSSWDSSGSYHNILWHINSSGQIFMGGFGGNTHTSTASSPVTINNWHHVCIASNGNSVEFYIDGVMSGGFNNSNHNDNMNHGCFLGSNMDGHNDGNGGSYRMNGYISNFRYVVGHKTYDSNFTPPTQKLTTTSQGVPAGACRFLACQDSTDFSVNSRGTAMTQDYGNPMGDGKNPFGADSPSGSVHALAGGGYGVYQSGQSCATSQNDIDKGRGGLQDGNTSDGGGDGGNGMQYSGCRQGGGGAGGYNGGGLTSSGCPSNHGYGGCSGSNGTAGGGGGGAGANSGSDYYAGGGGGVGIYGEGANGAKGDANQNGNPGDSTDFAGKGGSRSSNSDPGRGGLDGYTNRYSFSTGYNADGYKGGMTGYNRYRNNYGSVVSSNNYTGPDGGFPGGGAGGGHGSDVWGMGGHGVVRIIWGAPTGFAYRAFPSSMVDISTTYDSDADIFRIGTQPQY